MTKRRGVAKTVLVIVLLSTVVGGSGAPSLAAPERLTQAEGAASRSSVLFIENVGQWDERARFQVWGGPAGTMWLAEDGVWITVTEQGPREAGRQVDREAALPGLLSPDDGGDLASRRAVNIKLSFVDSSPSPRIEPFGRLDTVVSYFLGSGPGDWHANVPVWSGVRYVGLYPGVDLEVTSEDGRMVQRLAASRGADLAAVQLRVEGADDVRVEDGVLRLLTTAGEFSLPLLEEEDLQVAASQVQRRGVQAFEIARPIAQATLIGQPHHANPSSVTDNPSDLLYATFLGGGDSDLGVAIALDGAGRAYVAGYTRSGDFPTTAGAFDTSYNGGNHDAFVAKLNAAGSGLAYATFLGDSGDDYCSAIAVDGAGSAYVAGDTSSANFPTTTGAFDTSHSGAFDAFVARLNPAGSGLVYSTLLGGSGYDNGYAIAVDGAGSAYVSGWTSSTGFPTTPGAFDMSYSGDYDAFVAKLNPAGSGLEYSTFLGGSAHERGYAIALDGVGSAYVSGEASSTDFPTTTGAFDTSHNGASDAFVAKLNPAGSGLAYSTLLGGSADDQGNAIALDGAGSAYVTGETWCSDFPTTAGAFDTSHNGAGDAFVVKLNPAGSRLTYATFLGGTHSDAASGIALDGAGRAYVGGEYTSSSDFPTTPGGFDTSHNGDDDAFVAVLNPGGSALAYSTFLGSSGEDAGLGIALDGAGNAYVAGYASCCGFPTTTGAFDTTLEGDSEAFVAKLVHTGAPTPTPTPPAPRTYLPLLLRRALGH